MQRAEDTVVSFRINKELLGKFDELLEGEGIYIRSEGLRKLIISAVKRGKLSND